jgi:NADPH:quinone reductase-like Zn-dependent oxidoreductase
MRRHLGVPARGQVRVRTRAASLNFLDLMVARGDYPGIGYPLVPLADAAGEITDIGPGVTGFSVGDRFALHTKPLWIAGPGTAAIAQPTRGVTLPGALQEEQLVDANSVVRSPDHLSWEEIAALPIVETTANNALRSIAAGPGDTVLLLGTGGVSITALRLAKARGARYHHLVVG